MLIYARGEKVIKAHFLVIFARCRNLLDELIEENKQKIVYCPEVSKSVMEAFLKFVYSGQVEFALETEQDLIDAQFLAQKFPNLKSWVRAVKNPEYGGFIQDER